MKILMLILIVISFTSFGDTLVSSYIKKLASGTCGIATGAPLVQQLTETISYAGGMFWADDGEKIAYTDRYAPGYGRYTPSDGRFNHMSLNGTSGSEAIAIFPVNNATGLKFVIGLDKRLILSSLVATADGFNSATYNLLTVSTDITESFQKGKIDTKGRLWYSSSAGYFNGRGKLYKIENLGTPVVMEQNLYVGAGMAWTEDNKYFYLVEKDRGLIYKYDFNIAAGTIANRRIIFNMANHTNLTGRPYDIVVDSTGYLWIGLLSGGAVIQFDETTDSILWTIAIPASDIVSLEFGGLDKKTLYVGTSKEFLYNSACQQAAGSIMAVSGLGVVGITDNYIVIPSKYLDL